MRVLVATTTTQGDREDDYTWAIPGELVMFGVICADDLRGIGRGCGCGRAFAGLHSERATTTAEVVESPMRLGDIVMAFRDSLTKSGWIDDATGPEDAAELVHSAVMEMLTVADRYEPGTVIGTRLGSQYVRATAAAR
jgi:hypothetical protein